MTAEHTEVIKDMMSAQSLTLRTFCIADEFRPTKSGDRRLAQPTCRIDIVILGPFSLFEELGPWFDQYDVYLQDPKHMVEDVKYCNPHRLSFERFDDCPRVSDVVSQTSVAVHLRDLTTEQDLLDSYFSSSSDLEETPQPDIVTTSLERSETSL